MKNLEFQPHVYRVVINGTNGNTTWDLLTIDGETPKNTLYFMLKGDAPSFNQSNAIIEAIENNDWAVLSLEDSDNKLSDFSIDRKIFDTAGEGYQAIREELQKL